MAKNPVSRDKKLKIIELYKQGIGKKKIAKELKTSTKTITLVLEEKNIKTLPSGNNGKGGRPYQGGRKPRHWLYSTWSGIKQRCNNPNNKSYERYGGKGIKLYSEWDSNFELFKDYIESNLGQKEEGESLDRIDPLGNYEPGNIRWANATTQAYNKSNCFTRDLENVDTAEILKDKNLDVNYYTIKELQIEEEIKELTKSGVYIIKCISNNNYYIGSTKRSFRERWKEIRKHCKNDKNKVSKYLRKFWKECNGECNFRFGVLEIVEDGIKEREQYWINKLQPSLNIVKVILY